MDLTANDLSYMTSALAEIGAWTEQPVTLFTFSSVSYSGTDAEAGNPPTVTFGTRAGTARIDRISDKLLTNEAGVFRADDKVVTMRGSFSPNDNLVFAGGTYALIDGPYAYWIGSSLLWRSVARKVQS
jgi:hypothetical protein